MQNKAGLMILVVTTCWILVSNSGCGAANPTQSNFGSIAVPTIGAGNSGVLPGTSDGMLNDATYFYVGIDTKKGVIGHVHSTAGFSTPCGISKDSVANEDISCIIEIPEGDLYGKNLEIKVNVPNGEMCRFLEREPYWFYNSEIGYGPRTIAVSTDNTVNASGDVTASTYTCSFEGVVAACDSHPEIEVILNPADQIFGCIYNRNSYNEPNCCMGSRTITKTITKNGASPVTTVSRGKWGPGISDCVGGPGRTNWPKVYEDGTPAKIIQFVTDTGLTETQIVTAPANFERPLSQVTSSIHVASSYGDSADHTHTGFVNLTTTSTAPYYIDPIDDRDGTPISPANPSFDFVCVDAAFEVKHRIRAYVREWDTMPDFLAYVASAGTVVAPDRGIIAEPDTNCVGLGLSGLGSLCNDSWDADDFLKYALSFPSIDPTDGFNGLVGPTYEMTPVTKRKQYFPRIKYD